MVNIVIKVKIQFRKWKNVHVIFSDFFPSVEIQVMKTHLGSKGVKLNKPVLKARSQNGL